jgi:hypothetical protein
MCLNRKRAVLAVSFVYPELEWIQLHVDVNGPRSGFRIHPERNPRRRKWQNIEMNWDRIWNLVSDSRILNGTKERKKGIS